MTAPANFCSSEPPPTLAVFCVWRNFTVSGFGDCHCRRRSLSVTLAAMKLANCLLLLPLASLLSSCGSSQFSLEVCVTELTNRHSQMWEAYSSTNINVAEAGLLSYGSWLTNRMNDRRYHEIAEGFPCYLLETEGRLWALYEDRRETHSSARAYER